MPQSIGPSVIAAARRCSCGSTLGCTVKPSGSETCASAIRLSISAGPPVAVLGAALRGVVRDRCVRLLRAGWSGLADLGEDALELLLVVLQRLLGLLDRDVATTDQGLGVELADRALLLDQVVHQRLGVRRVVALVVTAAAVADEVDDDVLVERLAVLERQPGDPDAGLGVVAVHVEDRRLHHPGDVGAVQRRARRGGEVVKPTWLLTTTWIVPPVR